MKTIADTRPTVLPSAIALNVDMRATLMRRVFPLGLTLALWAVVIEGLRLAF